MTNTELTYQESIDQAIEILQQLKQQEDNNGAFILTTTQDDPNDKSSVLVSCVSTGSVTNQLTVLHNTSLAIHALCPF